MMRNLRPLLLPFLSLVSGFVLMAYELAAARILAPSIGSSTFIWTSVIGVIIAMLALGVWIGGRIADKRHSLADIGWIFLAAALTIAMMLNVAPDLLGSLARETFDPRLKGVLASLMLFAPTSFVIGAAGPYLAKLNVRSLEHTGRSVANLDSMNALGGIIGTFITGFVLFGAMGSQHIFTLLVFVLIAISWLADPEKYGWYRLMFAAVAVATTLLAPGFNGGRHIDTAQAHYIIQEPVSDGERTRTIMTGPTGRQSGVSLEDPDKLIFWYTLMIAEVAESHSSHQNILVLGGGTFTLPRYFAHKYPESQIDVVEIDPALVQIARDDFYYDDPANVEIIAQDARTYVNTTDKTYDIIVVDAYDDIEMPFTMITQEYGRSIARFTADDGIVIANIIAGQSGVCRKFLDVAVSPYTSQFRYGAYTPHYPQALRTNVIAVFSDVDLSDNKLLTWQLRDSPFIRYTDDYAPAEHLQYPCSQVYTR